MYKIREATAGDYQTFLPLYRESQVWKKENESHTELEQDVFKKAVADPAIKLYFVEKDGELHAFTLFYVRKSGLFFKAAGKEVLFIEELYVKSSEERKGLDQHLFQKIEKYARQIGMEQIEIAIPASAEKKVAYYEERLKLIPESIVLKYHSK